MYRKEAVWTFIKRAILKAMNLFIPKIKKKAKRYPRWFNSTIRHQLNCLHSLKRRNRSNPTEKNKLSQIMSCEEKLQEEMVSVRECHEENLIKSASSGNTYLIFKHIRSITGRNAIPTMVTYGNLTAASDYGKAILFNKFFYSVFVHSSFLLPSTDNLPTLVVSLGDISITEPDVYTSLASLDPSKAHGIDAIGPRILKYCAAALCQPIHHLFMLSLSRHYIPEEWCIRTIIPIFKSGDCSSVLCYRPISLPCSISKVLERIIYNAIVKFTTQYISLTQFGFLKNHSSQQQLLLFLSNFTRPSSPIDVVYIFRF